MKRDDVITDKGIGSLPRILDTINCFRRKHNTWPTRLLIDKEMTQALQQDNLTLTGWQALAKELDIKHSVHGTVIAEDDNGNSYEYEANHLTPEDMSNSADYWIWGCEVWPKSV
jgi:hypothetical protein